MSLPDRNQPGDPASASVSGDGPRAHALGASGYDGWLGGGRRRVMALRADSLTPAGDALLLVIPLKASHTRHDEQGIGSREVERQRQEERQKDETTHRAPF